MNSFLPADILIPNTNQLEDWSVIACDQFTSEPEYWEEVTKNTNDKKSTFNLILPEVYLGKINEEEKIKQINDTMHKYLQENVFTEYKNSYIYIERVMKNGMVRKGLIGAVDLEQYDFSDASVSNIRATEKTVIERIPPRMKIRRNAPLELSHILLLCDDNEKVLIEPITNKKSKLKKLYDFELMQDGGHIQGFLVDGEEAADFDKRLEKYSKSISSKYGETGKNPMIFAVGDGNHSLATAKSCYEELKKNNPNKDLSAHPARFALVELNNIHDEAQSFEPIHRIISDVDVNKLISEIEKECCSEDGYEVMWYSKKDKGTIKLDKDKGKLPIGILQAFLDSYLKNNNGNIDYIHGDETLIKLSKKENSIGFLLPPMEKSELFTGIISDGVLPRKTFSMGHAQEKRYYLEARKIV